MNRNIIFDYAKENYGTLPEYPWESYPEHAVLRHSGSGKWYAIIMRVNRRVLGLEGSGEIDVMNVKCDPLLIGSLRLKSGFLPAYHMNKDKWVSILLDGTVGESEVFPLIDLSYNLVSPKAKKRGKQQNIS